MAALKHLVVFLFYLFFCLSLPSGRIADTPTHPEDSSTVLKLEEREKVHGAESEVNQMSPLAASVTQKIEFPQH